jgi:hypothetical protein
VQNHHHPGAGRDPVVLKMDAFFRIPACAGMTSAVFLYNDTAKAGAIPLQHNLLRLASRPVPEKGA